jgi:hypothetical protein
VFKPVSLFLFACCTALSAQPLAQDVYVWQRAWSAGLRESLSNCATNFHQVVALAAEVSWKNNQPQPVKVALDYEALRKCRQPVGLALRIGPYSGPFRSDDSIARTLTALAQSLVRTAASNGLHVEEVQIDFDCAESKLGGYRIWIEVIRRVIAPTPVVITALPSWLHQSSFATLASSADGCVLQVHSLERPKSFEAPFTLCDPAAAKRAVAQAAKIPVSFRVALPTYGYVVAFDSSDKFIGLAAEGPSLTWPAGTRLREVRADSAAMAELIAFWNTNRPPKMTGVIWYRLSTSQDHLNWRFRTLGVVMRGRVPQADLKVESRSSEPALHEIVLRNDGSADFQSSVRVIARIHGARVIASDALGEFDLGKPAGDSITLRASQPFLRAGEERTIGWFRTNKKAEVELELQK